MERSKYLWCIQCERAFKAEEYRLIGGDRVCPYTDCNGKYAQAWEWTTLRKYNPDYPVVPDEGRVYPQFG